MFITLAGFTGIVFVFSHARGAIAPVDRFRLENVLGTSLGPAVLAYAPFVLEMLGLAGAAIWQWASGLLFVYLVVFFGIQTRLTRRLGEAELAVLRGGSRVTRALILVGLSNLVLQPLNVVGLLYRPNQAVFVVGLLLMLSASMAIFTRILFVRPGTGARDEPTPLPGTSRTPPSST